MLIGFQLSSVDLHIRTSTAMQRCVHVNFHIPAIFCLFFQCHCEEEASLSCIDLVQIFILCVCYIDEFAALCTVTAMTELQCSC